MNGRSSLDAIAPKRIDGLSRSLDDELLVYDARTHRVHCLNQTAAAVWRACDGNTTVLEIVRRLRQQNPGLDEEIVRMALAKLGRSGLLLEGSYSSNELRLWSRRKAIRRIGTVAAIALPVVTSILVPIPAQAASCRQLGQHCSSNAQCCSGLCLPLTQLCA